MNLVAPDLRLMLAAIGAVWAQPAASQQILDLPALEDGRRVIAFDPHVHTVFSDGLVWPTTRVDEAKRENLPAIAITDHVEWHPHGTDIPNPDLNRSYLLAQQAAATQGVVVVRGAEITRGTPPGHLNVIFLKDINPLLTTRVRESGTSAEMYEETKGDIASVEKALRLAKQQGAFVIFNHPYDNDGIARLPPENVGLIDKRLIDGIEVANRGRVFTEAIAFAIDHNLTFIGSSDTHNAISQELGMDEGVARTVTLVLAKSNSEAAIHEALDKRETAALTDNNIIGREPIVRQIAEASLKLYFPVNLPHYAKGTPDVTPAFITNSTSIAFTLHYVGGSGLLNAAEIFQVPAHSCRNIVIKSAPRGSQKTFGFEVMNSLISAHGHAKISLTAEDREMPNTRCRG